MNLKARDIRFLAYSAFVFSALSLAFLSVLKGFNGVVVVSVKPFSLSVIVDGSHSANCPINPQLPGERQQALPALPELKIA